MHTCMQLPSACHFYNFQIITGDIAARIPIQDQPWTTDLQSSQSYPPEGDMLIVPNFNNHTHNYYCI